jgi:hypothetical protein
VQARCESPFEAAQFADQQWPAMPLVAQTIQRAAVTSGSAANWASVLSSSGVTADFIQAICEREVLSRLVTYGAHRVPFETAVPIQSGAFGAD